MLSVFKKIKKPTALIAFIAISLIINIISKNNNNINKTASKEKSQVEIQQINSEEYTKSITLSGISKPSNSIDIKSMTSGQIIKISDKKGMEVLQGDVIAEIGNNNLANIFKKTSTTLEQKRFEYNTTKKLFKKNNTSKSDYLKSKDALDSALTEYNNAKQNLEYNTIRAPFDGTIGDIYIKNGDFVTIGQSIAKILNNELIFFGYASYPEMLEIKKDMPTEIVLIKNNNKIISCSISFIDPLPQPKTRTFLIESYCGKQNNDNMFGAPADIKIKIKQIQVFRIPTSAIFLDANKAPSIKIKQGDDFLTTPIDIVDQDITGKVVVENKTNKKNIDVVIRGFNYIKNEKETK